MDLSTIIGLILGLLGLIGGFFLEGGHFSALWGLSAFCIVLGGTLGATIIGTPFDQLKNIPKWLGIAFTNRALNGEAMYSTLIRFSEKARQEGLLSLESELDKIDDEFLRQGMQLVIDGTDPDITRSILEAGLTTQESRHKIGISFFEAAGGYAPTMGIIGTVMGLIHVLGNLSDADKLASAIAAAFIATLYGVSFANVFFLPLAAKLKFKDKSETHIKEMVLDAIISIQSGENPAILKEKLSTHLGFTPSEEKAAETE
ncbi:MAG: flagellar motor protein [Gracilibacteraceae bacterium]|jgi:chemotaxis protein MotA|nr:flagellar motor protein [Gracilibacteraceae bacterium]